ncbi:MULTISPECIES: DMT family transporter [unclassified Sphingopyxis]|uniref:DMT family transporter n=1 Tax=unclassified Sphingopyxis TaxID=2614943 RepID=UPI000736631D|nr:MULTISPECIES: multidrug efflux SMR transporter [unclassified Sphingopyxis]KTE38786.1 molecular chaperone [Sphingopyxis sp. HIX]KTE83265.1 molecular chaperone [Sphingopyxis sp. HXXIV]
MGWFILAIAVFTEICWALSLKWAATIGSWQASLVPVSLSFLNMALLAFAMRDISAGTAYAIWTGLGAVGVIIGGILLFDERVGAAQMGFMALIVIGVAGTKLFSAS